MSATRRLSPQEAAYWTDVGVLGALALMFAYAETFVPIPIPGVKLGLANIPVLVALGRKNVRGAACVALIKTMASGLLFGSPLTLAYSAAGTALSLAGMVPCSRLRTMRLWMLSVIGALLHEAGQLVVATVVMGTTAIWLATPALIVAGCATGLASGLLAQRIAAAMPCDRSAVSAECVPPSPCPPPPAALVSFGALLAFVVVVLRLEDVTALLACLLASLACCCATRVRPRTLLRATGPLLAVGAGTYVLQLVATPQSAAVQTARAILRLASVTLAGMSCMRLLPTNDVAATMAWLVQPLTRAGVRTQGFLLAFHTAVRLVPRMGAVVSEELAACGRRPGIHGLADLLPAIARRLLGEAPHDGEQPGPGHQPDGPASQA